MKKALFILVLAPFLSFHLLFATAVMEGRGQEKQNENLHRRAEGAPSIVPYHAEGKPRPINLQKDHHPEESNIIEVSSENAPNLITPNPHNLNEGQSHLFKKEKQFEKLRSKLQKRLNKKGRKGHSGAFGLIGFVLGIVGFLGIFIGFILFSGWALVVALLISIGAIVLSSISLSREDQRGFAVIGLILGILGTIIPLIMLAAALAFGGF